MVAGKRAVLAQLERRWSRSMHICHAVEILLNICFLRVYVLKYIVTLFTFACPMLLGSSEATRQYSFFRLMVC